MNIVKKIRHLKSELAKLRKQGRTVALVPTMGALHEGHLSLIRLAKKKADIVIVSIFVNPTQFGKNEDFSKYPRQERKDFTLLEKEKVDYAFAPDALEIYPGGFATSVEVSGLSDILCGKFRPGHFKAVATVVAKLLLMVMPDIAIFGEKDWQQLAIIRRVVVDLNIPVKITGAKTMREKDGLAMSSRNIYLSEAQRKIAPELYKTLLQVKKGRSTAWAKKNLIAKGFTKIDYIEIVDAETLATAKTANKKRILAAAWLGNTRLIDNI